MELSARPAITAGVALATAGMIAATPVLPAAPVVDVPDIQLVGFADTLEDWMISFNEFLYPGLLDVNQGLVDAEVGFEKLISPLFDFDFLGYTDADSILNGVPNRLFNVFNMGLGGVQNSLLGVLGAEFASGVGGENAGAGITNSLLVGLNNTTNHVFDTGAIGGVEGMFGQALQAFANVTGFPTDNLMDGLQNGLVGFNGGLVDFVKDFNGALKAGELGLERLIAPLFEAVSKIYNPDDVIYKSADSILNGVVNRGFNTFNMLLDAGQQGFLGLLGADFQSSEITSTLLTTIDVTGVAFNDGVVGGLEGFLGNGYMMLADLAGLIQALLGF
ncbi:hypothetical protein H7J77_05750 [Mycolicibacillus parakoreensis]|uniref:PE-PGRS family protein n=1 Tax=Mycolicibacillus parakoreensis TaxID=1069221 RepID=A0ABY3U853_9MYCO|nr:hypothetical protein [Mycolicibacillus parakoreensis]MCV7315040.1 hypothetical protein [Mycolicibacillus parakoreensis]ULN53604.1 hypothetical protein MIU77_04535 [Mycolicibacillus parakoreensis]